MRPMTGKLACLAACLALGLAAGAPAVAGKEEEKPKKESKDVRTAKQMHVAFTQQMGVHQDINLQEYVQRVGDKLAAASEMPELEWHFTIVDTDDVNAFATMGGYVYISRGILPYFQNEADLAAVLGHEIGHITAEHLKKQQRKGMLSGIASAATAIFTGMPALADLTNMAGQAIISGYGREAELEADRLGASYLAKAGYDPEAMIRVISTLKDQDVFERERARLENREPRLYHGVFASHPDNDTRLQQAVASAGRSTATGGTSNPEGYLQAIEGLPVGSSARQGMVRENRFYHADMQFTLAFPGGWQIQNQPDKILAIAPKKEHVMEIRTQAPPADLTDPRAFATRGLANRRLLLQLNLIAVLVAIEEPIAGGTEALPDSFRLRFPDWTDLLPLGLKLFQRRCGLIPIRRICDFFRRDAEGFLASQVGRPFFLPVLQIFLTTGEELIAGTAEALPDSFFVSPRDRTNGLPLRLQCLNLARGLHPVGRSGQRLDPLAQRLFANQITGPFFILGCEKRRRPSVDFILRNLETPPHRLALSPRRQRNLLPAGLQLPHPSPGDLEIRLRLQRFHLAADLFLHLQIGPALPFISVAQLLDARRQLGARLFETCLNLLSIALRRQRRPILERRADLTHRPVARLQRQRFSRRQRLDLPAELLHAPQVLLLLPRPRLLIFDFLLFQGGDRAFEPLCRHEVGRRMLSQHVCVTPQPAPPSYDILDWLFRRHELFELGR